jgi:hypothetical protein
MKKFFRRLAMLLFFTALIPSCDLLEDCKTCKLKTDDNGTITYGSGIETCGDALAEREAEEPVTVGNVTTSWVCE